jgi:hypothetical protein
MRMTNIGDTTTVFGALEGLTIYSSNFAEMKYSKNSISKVKYRVKINLIFPPNIPII